MAGNITNWFWSRSSHVWGQNKAWAGIVLLVGLGVAATASLQATPGPRSFGPRGKGGDPDLDAAVQERDTDKIVSRMIALARENPAAAAIHVPLAYATMEASSESDFYQGDRYRVFKGAVNVIANLRGEKELKSLQKLFKKTKKSAVKFLLLHASIRSKGGLDAEVLCLAGLEDKGAEVVALSARIAGNTKKTLMLDPLLDAMRKWEKRTTQEKVHKGRKEVVAAGTDATAWLSCRDALHRLTGQNLHAVDDFRNYIKQHRAAIDPENVDLGPDEDAKTGTGLFGLDVTGKYIMFVLDISGSMEATDPFTPEQLEKLSKGRTGVGVDKLEEEMLKERKRILRAKRELSAVIRSLPEDRRFNVVVYSTYVTPWKESLTQSTEGAKKKAVEFVEALEAKGVTATDDALHRAFSDPLCDTIYLITDGAPTHLGSRGPDLPEDAPRLMDRILNEAAAANYLRQIRIFTLGFEGAEIPFLTKLAEQNHGTYHNIR